MDIQTKKLHFIQEVLALRNEKIIDKLESFLKREQLKEVEKTSIYDLVGVISEEEGESMKKEIQKACENIQEADWQ